MSGIVVSRDYATITKTRIMAGAPTRHPHQVVRLDREPAGPLPPAAAKKLWAAAAALAEKVDAFVFSDYGYGAATPELGATLSGLRVADSRARIAEFRGFTALTPNAEEASEVAGHPVLTEDETRRAGHALLAKSGAENAVITRGNKGMAVFTRDGREVLRPRLRHRGGHRRDRRGRHRDERRRPRAGGRGGAGGRRRAREPRRRHRRDEARRGHPRPRRAQGEARVTARFVADHSELASVVASLRAAGKTVVFANGCFDLLHVGHVRYLRGAKAEGDVLLLALNDDASVRRNKGPERPVQTEMDRVEIVSALEMVDLVTLFSDPTVDRLLDLLRPDVHAKGTDYTLETVPERATVLAYGGRIAIVGDPKDHSSSQLLKTIRKG